MDLKVVAEVAAFGKEDKVGQTEGPADNLAGLLLVNAEFGRTVPQGHRLGRERALAAKGQRTSYILDIHRLGHEQGHVPADLLEVQRRHGNTSRKRSLGHIDIRVIAIKEIELVADAALLLPVLEGDRQVIGLGLGHTEGNRIIIRHRLDHAIEVIRVQADVQPRGRMIVLVMLKLARIEAHVGEDRTGIVHGDHADPLGVEDQAHLHEHGLETLSERANGSGLHGFCDDETVVGHFVYPLGGV